MRMLDYLKSDGLLKKYGLKTAKSELVAGTSSVAREKLRVAALKIGFPIVLKAISKDIPNMSAVGGVLTVSSPDQFDKWYDTLLKNIKKKKPKARLQGMVVQKQLAGKEYAITVRNDTQFGVIVQLGRCENNCRGEHNQLGICVKATGFAPLEKKQAETLVETAGIAHPALGDVLIKASRCGVEQKLNMILDVIVGGSIEIIDAKLFDR